AERSPFFGRSRAVPRGDFGRLDQLLQRPMLLLSARHWPNGGRVRPAGETHKARKSAEQRQILQHIELYRRAAAAPGIAANSTVAVSNKSENIISRHDERHRVDGGKGGMVRGSSRLALRVAEREQRGSAYARHVPAPGQARH